MRKEHMRVLFQAGIFGAILAGTTVGANAACYDYALQPVTLSCDVDGSNSADFGTNCTSQAAQLVRFEVACPQTPGGSGGFNNDKSGDYYDGVDRNW